MRKRLILLLLPLVLLAGLYGGWNWWHVLRYQQSTDDAYIQSDVSLIPPTIEGTIKEVRVQDNQRVEAGQILFIIDDADFVAPGQQAEAAVASEEAVIATLVNRQQLQQAMIEQAESTVQAAEVEVNRA